MSEVAVPDAPVADDAPKPKRVTKKAAAAEATADVADATAADPQPEAVAETAAKPKRATKATAKTAPLEPEVTATDGVAAAPSDEPAAKPKRAAKKAAAVPSGEVAS